MGSIEQFGDSAGAPLISGKDHAPSSSLKTSKRVVMEAAAPNIAETLQYFVSDSSMA